MSRISSFKAQYRQAPTRAPTPPPPEYEPLSPILLPADPSTQSRANRNTHQPTYHNTLPNGADGESSSRRESNPSSLLMGTAPSIGDFTIRSTPLSQPRAHFSAPLGSPIEALADVAVTSQQTSPAYGQLSHRPPHPHSPAMTVPQMVVTSERAVSHSYISQPRPPHELAYSYNERPAKRARSEFYASPPYGQSQPQSQSRPATSHIPGWSYNVEQMADNGMRMYQNDRAPTQQQPPTNNDRLSDAQLLLDFFNVSAHTAQTPPSTAKRWSVSHPVLTEQSAQHPQHLSQVQQPYPATIHPSSQYAQPPQELPFVKPLPEPPVQPSASTAPVTPAQIQTPPDEKDHQSMQPQSHIVGHSFAEEPKPKKQQGWPKGKPRGPRNSNATSKRKRSTPKPKTAPPPSGPVDQLQSPQSLVVDRPHVEPPTQIATAAIPTTSDGIQHSESQARRHSFSNSEHQQRQSPLQSPFVRARSLPLENQSETLQSASLPPQSLGRAAIEQPDLICAACKSSESEVKAGDGEQWIGCDGCKEWHHYACAGFNSEREVRDVNKFYCEPCRPKFGETTKVRKSVRAHTTVDYAGLNEGVLKTSDDNPEHHYIAAFKNGDMDFTPETFARLPPELITGDWLEKTNGFKEPILIPGALNGRPVDRDPSRDASDEETDSSFEYETVEDDGQDKLDMVIPKGLTVRRVAELYGANEPVPVIDVKAQEGEGKKWTMGRWADYYEQQGEKPVRNVISLEVSRSRLGKLIRRPKGVRDMDLQDAVWREDDKAPPPPVQFYCLMSVADCFTDFHIDFGGSSVYYHIVKGKKVFFFIPPTKQNLKKYEDWCLSPNQGHDWLGKQVKECYRVDLYPGDTMLIPSGWIHAVWTPEDSLVIGGNFLTRIHYGMQIKVLEIEKNTKVALQFRYPFFQKIMWLTAIKYLEEDPVPEQVQQLLQSGNQFQRSVPIYCQPDNFGNNSSPESSNYNRRYYSKHELEGLPEVLAYIWRTVLIVSEKIDVPQRTRNAVNKSIPKGFGDPLTLARRFAMWIAWKRGNESIPTWAIVDVNVPPEAIESTEMKLSTALSKKPVHETSVEMPRAMSERASARLRATDLVQDPALDRLPSLDTDMVSESEGHPVSFGPTTFGPLTGFLRPSPGNPYITTPKTSQLGPKRVACDACRKRRIRCKHKDELVDSSKPGMHTIDLSGSYGISVKRRLSDHSLVDGQGGGVNGPVNGGPIMADVNGDPYALKSGRVKACADCRKSKRRCIHDEYGNVDPIKANEVPIPRGSASKKRRVSDENLGSSAKRMKHELSGYEEEYMNGDVHQRHSVSDPFHTGSSFLQDLAYSAQQALDQTGEDLVPVDPSLQAYTHGDYQPMDVASSYQHNGDHIMTSVEQPTDPALSMDGIERSTGRNGEPHGPSVEPLTPGPPFSVDNMQTQPIGYKSGAFATQPFNAFEASAQSLRHRSPRATSAISPTTRTANIHPNSPPAGPYYDLVENNDYSQAPVTPTTNSLRPVDGPSSSKRKAHTPSRGGRASKTPKSHGSAGPRKSDMKDSIKLEHDLLGAIDPNLDQASIDLIKQLQQEDLGLRRRSR